MSNKLPTTLVRFLRLKTGIEFIQRHAAQQGRQQLADACGVVITEMSRWLDEVHPTTQP